MVLKPRVLMLGALSLVPGVNWVHRKFWIRPNIATAENSYGVWLKHLTLATVHGGLAFPKTLMELGPGMSTGVGLAALISGVESYVGMDVMPFVERRKMPEVFDRLVELFRARNRPDNAAGFPNYEGLLDDDGFPGAIVSREQLARSMSPERLDSLRRQVDAFSRNAAADEHPAIGYRAPWRTDQPDLASKQYDMIMSHGVLQHIDNLTEPVRAFERWLRPGGVTTHQMDLSSLTVSVAWNGHWACPDWEWRMALGKKDFLINRLPASRYVDRFESAGLKVAQLLRQEDRSGFPRDRFIGDWRQMSLDDAVSRRAFLVACKP